MNRKGIITYILNKYYIMICVITAIAVVIFGTTLFYTGHPYTSTKTYASTEQDIEKVVEKVVRARELFQSVYGQLMSHCRRPTDQKTKPLSLDFLASVNEAGKNVHEAINGLLQTKKGVKQLPQHAIGQLRQLTKLEHWDGKTDDIEGGQLGCTYDVDIMRKRFDYALDYLSIWKNNGFE